MLFELVPLAPFRLDFTVWALRRLPVNEVDRWDGLAYRRVLRISGSTVEVVISQRSTAPTGTTAVAGQEDLGVSIRRNGKDATEPVRQAAAEAVSYALGIQADLTPFYRLAADDKRLSALVSHFKGLKPPRFFSPFEGIVNGIACQQLSLNVGITLLNRLCQGFGPRIGDSAGFPDPDNLASVEPAALRPLGFSRRKAETIVATAQAVVSGELDLDVLGAMDDEALAERLQAIKGVGRWTAQYVALRGLGRWDVFPVDDVGGQNKVMQWLGLPTRPDPLQMQRLLAPYAPYRGLLYFHLLLGQLEASGALQASQEWRSPP